MFLSSLTTCNTYSSTGPYIIVLNRKQRTDVGEYSFVNRTITDWNQLTEGEIGAITSNTYSFRQRVREVITSAVK